MSSNIPEGPMSRPSRDGTVQPDPFRWRTRPSLQRTYRIAGFNVAAASNDARIIAAMDRAFNPAAWPMAWSGECHLRVELMRDSLREDPEWQLHNPMVRTNGSLMSITYGRHNSIVIDISGGAVLGYLTDDLVERADFLVSDVAFAAVMCWIYVLTNGFVHGAALTRDGRSFLLRGASGAGKSTLTYALVQRGFKLVAEDALYVHACSDPRSATVHPDDAGFFGVPWQLQLLPDTVRYFPELHDAPRIVRPSGEEKLVVDLAATTPHLNAPEAPAGPVIFLARNDTSTSTLCRLSREQTLDHLYATSFAYEPHDTNPGTLWGLFLHYPAYLIVSGDNPHEAAALLDAAFTAGLE